MRFDTDPFPPRPPAGQRPTQGAAAAQTEQEVDEQVGRHLAAQLRELLATQPLELSLARILPGILLILRRGTRYVGTTGATSALSVLLESSWSSLLVQELSVGARVDAIPAFLDAILLSQTGAAHADDATSEAFFERFKPKSTRGLCGYLFQRNDIAFNCRTCQLDETCVLCLKCYQNGNHDGHDIYFHRTQPGGMCDCGDAEAWDPDGFCIYHGHHDDDSATGEGSGPQLPDTITRVADALFEEIVTFLVEMATRSRGLFDPDQVDVIGRRVLEEYQRHQALCATLPQSPTQQAIYSITAPRFHVRICNDDVHSDEDLVTSLTRKHIREARRLVRAIDSNGSEIVARDLALRDALVLMQELKSEGWHVCVIYDQHIRDEEVLIKLISWIKMICTHSKPMQNLFCTKLFTTTNALASPKEPIQVMFLSDPYFRKEIVLVLYELYLKLQSDKDPKLQFSLVFLKVYSRLMYKYFCGVGTRDESLFQYGVQIFTTPSIVSHLASLGLLDILLDTLHRAIEICETTTTTSATRIAATGARRDSGTPANGSPSTSSAASMRTLDCDHAILKFKRYGFVVDNFGYVMNIAAMSSRMLLDRDLVTKWLGSLRHMQGLDAHVRIQDGHAHVTYETQTWFSAFNFHSYVSRLMTILCKGLRQHEGDASEKVVMVNNVLTSFWEQLEHSGVSLSDVPSNVWHCPTFGFGVSSISPLPHRADAIIKYDVASQPVSFHYPLHGFLANFLLESLYYGPPVQDWRDFIESSLDRFVAAGSYEVDSMLLDDVKQQRKQLLTYGMLEFPLRTLVLCAQIQSGMWIRNGQSMHRQMLHYTNPPLCSELRDLDLFLVQVSACTVGFSKFLSIFFDRFGLMQWLHTWSPAPRQNERHSTASVGGIGRHRSRSEDDNEGEMHKSHTSRSSFSGNNGRFPMGEEKLVSLLECALLQLIWMVTELPPPQDQIDERDIWLRREIIHRLAQQPCRLSELLDQTGFVTSTPFGGVSSPQGNEHLARLERILEDVAEVQVKRTGSFSLGAGAMSSSGDEGGDSTHSATDESTNSGGHGMEPTKFVLRKDLYREYDPSFYHLARPAHEKAQFARQDALFKSWQPDHEPIALVASLPPAHPSFSCVRMLVFEKGLLGIIRLILEDATSDNTEHAKKTTVLVILRAVHILTVLVHVLKSYERNEVINEQILASPTNTKRRRVLYHLRCGSDTFEDGGASRGQKRYKRGQGDEDIDIQMSSDDQNDSDMNVDDRSIVAMLVTLAKDQIQHDFDTSKSTISAIYWILKELAGMDPAIQEYVEDTVWKGMKKSQDHAHEHGLSKAQLKKLHQQRAIEAMQARQKAFATSALFAEMEDLDDEEEDEGVTPHGGAGLDVSISQGDTIVYRPPPPPDCIICTQKKKNEPVMYIGHAQTSQVLTHALQEKPFPAAPLSETFPPPVFLSLCGHAVHLQCWRKYFESVRAQSRYNIEHSQSNIAFDAHFGEFLCPLCQSLSSMLVPYVPPSPILTLDEQQRGRDAMEKVFQAKQDTSSILDWLTHGLPERIASLEDECQTDVRAPSLDQHESMTQDMDPDEDDSYLDYSDDEDDDKSADDSRSPDEDAGRFFNTVGTDDAIHDVSDASPHEDAPHNGGRGSSGPIQRERPHRGRAQTMHPDDVRAMRQFAMSFLETLARFQIDLTHVSSTIAALKKSFFATGPQLAHLIWSAVASTFASAQLSGISSAIYSFEMANSPTESFLARKRIARTSPASRQSSDSSPGSMSTAAGTASTGASFSSLRITSILNPPLPSLKTRLAVGLPESLDSQLDPFSPRDDSKLNCLLRAIRQMPYIFRKHFRGFARSIGLPVRQALKLSLSPDQWLGALTRNAPLQLGQPILGQDLFYLCVAICSSMVHTKAEILLTLRSMCVLHMAQVLLQISRLSPEDFDEDEDCGEHSEERGQGDEDMDTPMDCPDGGERQVKAEIQAERLMSRSLSILMDRLSTNAGVDKLARAERDGAPYSPPSGSQLLQLFQSSMLSFMRQVTLLCRAFFRGENDPDASWNANFVSSLRLSTNYHGMAQQLGLPSVDQVLQDASLMSFLEKAAAQLRQSRFACVPDEVQYDYRQHGHLEGMLQAVEDVVTSTLPTYSDEGDAEMWQLNVIMRNMNQLPALPIRCIEEQNSPRQFFFANVRLVRLAPLYTDLHSEVLARSRCPLTGKIVENPAICMVCEQVLCAGTDCCRRASDGMGACTAHAIACGHGVGLFFLMRSSSVLLVFGPRSSYFGSPYLDMFGEEDINLRRGRPLYLNGKRMKTLLRLYANHQLANEVARNRRTSDQYIRNNYY
ncbi:hypothetical protein PINS_up012419 [Pythium insidiosum]|nr:hypothetical protein PINS_up012419 [Pythium insidiosum]